MTPHRMPSQKSFVLGLLTVGLLASIAGPSWSVAQEATSSRQFRDRFAGRSVTTLREDLLNVQSKLQKLRAQIKLLGRIEKSISELPIADAEIEARLAEEPVVQELQAQLTVLQGMYKEARIYWVESHPVVTATHAQLQLLQKMLQDYRTERLPELVENLPKELQQQFDKDVLVPLQDRLALLVEEEKDLKGAIEQSEVRAASIKEAEDRTGQRIARLEDEVRQLREAIEGLKKTVGQKRR